MYSDKSPFGSLEEDYVVLYCLVAAMKPTKVLELGTHAGISACAMAQAMVDYKVDGKIFTVDAHQRGDFSVIAKENREKYGFTKIIEFHYGLSWEVGKQLSDKYFFDLSFIDAGHDYASVAKDYVSIVYKTRYTVFDNVYDCEGVSAFLNDLKNEKIIPDFGHRFEILRFPTTSIVRNKTVGKAIVHDTFV